MKFHYLFLAIVLVFSSCTQNIEELDTSQLGYEYYPVNTGKMWVYISDSIIYSRGGNQIDTLRSFIREEVGDYTEDIEGNKVYKIFRSIKRDENDPWQRLNTWTTYVDKSRVIRTEENVKLIKMVFPLRLNQRFDGNAFVDKNNKILVGGELMDVYKDWRHRVERLGDIQEFNGNEVETCYINLVEDESIIDKRDVKETYAKGIGLLSKSKLILELNAAQPNVAWNEKITRGFIHKLTLIEYQ